MLPNNKAPGFTLTELLVGVAIFSVVAAIVATVITVMSQSQNAAMGEAQVQAVMRDVVNSLGSQFAWTYTTTNGKAGGSRPAQMDCLDGASALSCSVGGGAASPPLTNVPFALYDARNNIQIDTLTANTGFDFRGQPCVGFQAPPAAGNDACPLRYELTWSALCTAGDCVKPAVEVNGTLLYNPANKSLLNLNWSKFNIVKFVIGNDLCTNGFQAYLFPGDYTFNVPTYARNLVVEVWGGGGGSNGVYGPAAGNGGESSWNDAVRAGGGEGGNGTTYYFWSPPTSIGNAAGGIASGGLININGAATNPSTFYIGASAPTTGLQTVIPRSPCNAQLTGGGGGPGSMNNKLAGGDGFPGQRMGGGGGSVWACLGFWWIGMGWGFTAEAGGAGAYSSRWYPAGTWAPGTPIHVVVGAGGAGTDGASTTLWTGAPYRGGSGADGGVIIMWE